VPPAAGRDRGGRHLEADVGEGAGAVAEGDVMRLKARHLQAAYSFSQYFQIGL
jgi:hypothetical protein